MSGSFPERHVRFPDRHAWLDFVKVSPWLFSPDTIGDIVRQARTHGVRSDFLGAVPPDQVSVGNPNYRELLLAGGFSPRQRTMLDVALSEIAAVPPRLARIYAHEALTPFALLLRSRYPRLICSEYAATEEARSALFPIPAIDISAAPFPDGVFDLVLSGDVLEHVPDLAASLRDTARILRSGGVLLASFPFMYMQDETKVQARLEHGKLVTLAEPEYHGNPADPEAGSLVFQVPGWSILSLARQSGFAGAEIGFWASASRGLTGMEIAGTIYLRAVR